MELEALRTALRRARDAAGLTLDELQRRSGVNRNTISAIELGRKVPTIRTLARIIEALPQSDEAHAPTFSLARFFEQLEPLTPAVTSEVNISGSADSAGANLSEAAYARRVPSADTDRVDALVHTLERIVRELAVVNQDVQERAAAFIMAAPDERLATARRILGRDRLSREHGGKARRKAR